MEFLNHVLINDSASERKEEGKKSYCLCAFTCNKREVCLNCLDAPSKCCSTML